MDPVQTMQAEPSQLSSSPSFSCYSSETETLAEIAARVINELRHHDPHSLSDNVHDATLFDDSWETDNFVGSQVGTELEHRSHRHHDPNGNVVVDADDFEFAFVCRDSISSPVSADDIFCNGQIMPMYPLFDRNLLFANLNYNFATTPNRKDASDVSASPVPTVSNETAAVPRGRRLPLRKLMFEERETESCSSSTSEAEDNNNELDGVASGTYCVWNPKSAAAEESIGRPCKKSSSTGSASKRWKLRDLILRSHSDGKEPLLFLGQSKRSDKVAHEVVTKPGSADNGGAGALGAAAKEAEHQTKKKSFLHHRRLELVGLFTNGNGVGRNLQPF